MKCLVLLVTTIIVNVILSNSVVHSQELDEQPNIPEIVNDEELRIPLLKTIGSILKRRELCEENENEIGFSSNENYQADGSTKRFSLNQGSERCVPLGFVKLILSKLAGMEWNGLSGNLFGKLHKLSGVLKHKSLLSRLRSINLLPGTIEALNDHASCSENTDNSFIAKTLMVRIRNLIRRLKSKLNYRFQNLRSINLNRGQHMHNINNVHMHNLNSEHMQSLHSGHMHNEDLVESNHVENDAVAGAVHEVDDTNADNVVDAHDVVDTDNVVDASNSVEAENVVDAQNVDEEGVHDENHYDENEEHYENNDRFAHAGVTNVRTLRSRLHLNMLTNALAKLSQAEENCGAPDCSVDIIHAVNKIDNMVNNVDGNCQEKTASTNSLSVTANRDQELRSTMSSRNTENNNRRAFLNLQHRRELNVQYPVDNIVNDIKRSTVRLIKHRLSQRFGSKFPIVSGVLKARNSHVINIIRTVLRKLFARLPHLVSRISDRIHQRRIGSAYSAESGLDNEYRHLVDRNTNQRLSSAYSAESELDNEHRHQVDRNMNQRISSAYSAESGLDNDYEHLVDRKMNQRLSSAYSAESELNNEHRHQVDRNMNQRISSAYSAESGLDNDYEHLVDRKMNQRLSSAYSAESELDNEHRQLVDRNMNQRISSAYSAESELDNEHRQLVDRNMNQRISSAYSAESGLNSENRHQVDRNMNQRISSAYSAESGLNSENRCQVGSKLKRIYNALKSRLSNSVQCDENNRNEIGHSTSGHLVSRLISHLRNRISSRPSLLRRILNRHIISSLLKRKIAAYSARFGDTMNSADNINPQENESEDVEEVEPELADSTDEDQPT